MFIKKNEADIIRTEKHICQKCGTDTEFSLTSAGNYIFVCPVCKELCGIDCEYGYANIVPCDILLGTEKIGEITEYRTDHNIQYRLSSDRFQIHKDLSGGYADIEAYKEAIMVLRSFLKGDKDNSESNYRQFKRQKA